MRRFRVIKCVINKNYNFVILYNIIIIIHNNNSINKSKYIILLFKKLNYPSPSL